MKPQCFTIRIGTNSLPMRGRQLIEGPVFEAQRIPSNSGLFSSCVQDWLRNILPHLPFCIQSWLRDAFPAWFLPTRLIVKELDPENLEAFYTEGRIYARLQHLQGRVIPMYYGTARIKRNGETEMPKAHLFELVDGIPLCECTEEQSNQFRTEEKIHEAFALLSEKDVVHGDPWPRHIIHTKQGTIRIIDFGEAYVTDEADDLNKGDAQDIIYRFGLQHERVSTSNFS
jgi:hypothetical protein